MVDATEWHEQLHYLSETKEVMDDYRNWGYTIYRTAYGPSTKERWHQLLDKLDSEAYTATLRVCETKADDPAVQKLWSLFRLDPRSDPALEGLSMEELRLRYRNGNGGVPMNADLQSHRVLLLADEEVLSNPEGSLVKCVDADYEAANYVPCNTRLGRQSYFGWMTMESAEIVALWKKLEDRDLDRIAPRTVEGFRRPEIWRSIAF